MSEEDKESKEETSEKSKSKKDDSDKKDSSRKKDDSKKSKDESKKKDSSDDGDSKQRPPAPHWSSKVLRTFIFATLGAFISAYLFANGLPNGLRVDFDLIASIKFGLITGVVSAILRAFAAMLPLFPDD